MIAPNIGPSGRSILPVSELEVRVEQLQKEVEQLREQMNQQKQLADSGCRQRDVYRILLTQNTGYSLPPHGTEASPQPSPPRTPIPAAHSTPQRAAALKQLNDAYSVYKKEKAEYDRLLSEKKEKAEYDRLLSEKTERLQQEVMELRASKEFSNKRYEMLQCTAAAYRREISALQARSTRTAALNQQQESIIHTLTHDHRLTNERLALEELTMERNEADTISSKVEHLEAELVAMRTKLDQEVEQRHAQGRNMDCLAKIREHRR
ncbi:unnamed protein product [Boreogadus saida]